MILFGLVVLVFIGALFVVMRRWSMSPVLVSQKNTSNIPVGNSNISTTSTINSKNSETFTPFVLAKDYYTDSDFDFKIKLPEGWVVLPGKTENVIVDFVSPVSDQEVGNLPLSGVTLSINNYGNQFGNDAEAAKNNAVGWLSRNLQNFKVLTEERMVLHGSDSYLLSGSYVLDGVPFNAYYLIVCSNSLKDFFITAPVNQTTWNQYKDVLSASLQTFEVK